MPLASRAMDHAMDSPWIQLAHCSSDEHCPHVTTQRMVTMGTVHVRARACKQHCQDRQRDDGTRRGWTDRDVDTAVLGDD